MRFAIILVPFLFVINFTLFYAYSSDVDLGVLICTDANLNSWNWPICLTLKEVNKFVKIRVFVFICVTYYILYCLEETPLTATHCCYIIHLQSEDPFSPWRSNFLVFPDALPSPVSSITLNLFLRSFRKLSPLSFISQRLWVPITWSYLVLSFPFCCFPLARASPELFRGHGPQWL